MRGPEWENSVIPFTKSVAFSSLLCDDPQDRGCCGENADYKEAIKKGRLTCDCCVR